MLEKHTFLICISACCCLLLFVLNLLFYMHLAERVWLHLLTNKIRKFSYSSQNGWNIKRFTFSHGFSSLLLRSSLCLNWICSSSIWILNFSYEAHYFIRYDDKINQTDYLKSFLIDSCMHPKTYWSCAFCFGWTHLQLK